MTAGTSPPRGGREAATGLGLPIAAWHCSWLLGCWLGLPTFAWGQASLPVPTTAAPESSPASTRSLAPWQAHRPLATREVHQDGALISYQAPPATPKLPGAPQPPLRTARNSTAPRGRGGEPRVARSIVSLREAQGGAGPPVFDPQAPNAGAAAPAGQADLLITPPNGGPRYSLPVTVPYPPANNVPAENLTGSAVAAPNAGGAEGGAPAVPMGPLVTPRTFPGNLPPTWDPRLGPPAPEVGVELPFEVIDFTEELTITVRRHKLLRYQAYITQVQIADPSVVEASVYPSGHELGLIGVGQGATTVTVWFNRENAKPVTFLVRVQPDPEIQKRRDEQYQDLEAIIREQFPDSKVHLEARGNKLFVKGQAKDSEEAHMILTMLRDSMSGLAGGGWGGAGGAWLGAAGGQATSAYPNEATGRNGDQIYIVNRLRVPGVQTVALKVKLAELNRTAARNFNLNVRGNVRVDNGTLVIQSLVNAATQGASAISGTFSNNDINFSIRFLKQHGVVRLLSEPTLVAMSGQPAYFHAGGEFAVPTTVGVAGAQAVATNFRAFGSIVTFIPTVVDKDRVRLQIYPEFTQVNNSLSVNNIPGLNSRGVGTTVELREGQTYAIAGLIDDTFSANRASDFPFLGNLLGARTATAQETELLILVTPELVHPMDPEEVPPLPGFDVTQPTDVGFFLHGQTEGYPTHEHRATVWPRLYRRYQGGASSMLTNQFGHGQ